MKKLVMVETLSQYRMRYVVQVEDDIDHALDMVVMGDYDPDFKEFSQKHLGPSVIVDHYEISENEYITMFDKDNDYLISWTDEQKKSFINVIDYHEPKEMSDDGA
jgi:hypothetical protein